ncbi:MAG: hypothetical protein JXR41_05945 [Bacteroidales bacterium]|nr:hypothetical protein [Bacteroidales bacterium]MBN2762612.1 hypothetical protein [Bacteroidales bacterium]
MRKIAERYFLTIMVILTLFTAGCEKDKKDAPQLPPESAFLIDFSDFQDNSKSTQTYTNWTAAAVTVGVWNTVLTVTLAVPVAAYIEALKHEPVRVDNDSWKWSYTVTVNAIQYTADLFADVSGSNVAWEMYISQQGGFSNFLWFKGNSNILRTKGDWTLYQGPLTNAEFLSIDWNHDWEKNTADIKYTNILSGTDGMGDYIHYGITEDLVYDAFYDIYDNSADNLLKINYNTETREGSIYYNDLWHCWDNNLVDIDCAAR